MNLMASNLGKLLYNNFEDLPLPVSGQKRKGCSMIKSLHGEAANYAFIDLHEEFLRSGLLVKALIQRINERTGSNAFLPQIEVKKLGQIKRDIY